MALYIHEGTILWRRGQLIRLSGVSQIFTCPDEQCEYIMTARTEGEAVTIRDTHMRICHPLDLQAMRWEEAFETDVPDYVTRVLNGANDGTSMR